MSKRLDIILAKQNYIFTGDKLYDDDRNFRQTWKLICARPLPVSGTYCTYIFNCVFFKINFHLFVFNLFYPPNSTVICIFLLTWRVILKIIPIWKNGFLIGPKRKKLDLSNVTKPRMNTDSKAASDVLGKVLNRVSASWYTCAPVLLNGIQV